MPRRPRLSSPSLEPDTDLYSRDLRSAGHAQNRHRAHTTKYYNHRSVDPNWVGQPYHKLSTPSHRSSPPTNFAFHLPYTLYPSCAPLVSLAERMTVATWTKHDMWDDRDRDIWPLDRRHHRGKKIRERRSQKWTLSDLGRRMKQRQREWGFALEEGDLASVFDDDLSVWSFREEMGLYDVDEGCAEGEGEWPDEQSRWEDDAAVLPESSETVVGVGAGMILIHVDVEDLDRYEVLDLVLDDDDDFSIISERDFDVISISSGQEDEDGVT